MTDPKVNPAPPSHVVFHVLLCLSEGPRHGYAIMKQVEADAGLIMGPGTVYGALHRLTEAGWIEEVNASESGTDARRGKSFNLTEEGTRALAAEAQRISRLAHLDRVRRLVPEGTA